jgi:hypothetical protein
MAVESREVQGGGSRVVGPRHISPCHTHTTFTYTPVLIAGANMQY